MEIKNAEKLMFFLLGVFVTIAVFGTTKIIIDALPKPTPKFKAGDCVASKDEAEFLDDYQSTFLYRIIKSGNKRYLIRFYKRGDAVRLIPKWYIDDYRVKIDNKYCKKQGI